MQTANIAPAFPAQEPRIEIAPIEGPPFAVECRELRWWFIVPETGRRRRWATYNYPDRNLHEIVEMQVAGPARVYDEEGFEIRCREFRPDGSLNRESYAYGVLRDGAARWLAWWNAHEGQKFYTYKDEFFLDCDWSPCPIAVADVGRFRWLDENRVEAQAAGERDPVVDGIGAGLWRLRVDGREFRCLRTLDVDEPVEPHSTLCEAFLDDGGRVLVKRSYANGTRSLDGGPAAQVLAASPTLTCAGVTYYRWYDQVAEDALGIG